MSLISEKSFLKRREIIYLLIIFFPLLISLPVIIYYSWISQAPKRGITAGLVFKDNFNNCAQSNLGWQGHISGGWGCRETGGFGPVPTSGAPSLSPVPTLRSVSCFECDFNTDNRVNHLEIYLVNFCQGSIGPNWRMFGSVSCQAVDLNKDNKVDSLDQDFWRSGYGCSQYFGQTCTPVHPTSTPFLSVTLTTQPTPTLTPTPTLMPVSCQICDFNQDSVINLLDVDLIASADPRFSCLGATAPNWKKFKGISCEMADLNRDKKIDSGDQEYWQEEGGCSQFFGESCLLPTPTEVGPTPKLNGTYSYQVPSEVIAKPRESFAILKNKDFDNLSLESMIRIQEIQEGALPNNGAGIQVRVSVDDLSGETPLVGGYLCFLKKDKLTLQRYQLASSSSGLRPLDLAVRNFNLEVDFWYKLRMEAVGKDLRCVVADAKGSQLMEVSYEDTNSLTEYEKQAGFTQNGPLFAHGTVGFVSYLTPADWDNFEVRSLVDPTSTPTPTSLPTPTPTVTPVVKAWLSIKAQFDGFTDLNKGKMSVALKAKGTNLNKIIILYEDGITDEIPLDNLEPGTYEFILSSFGYLSAKRSLTITAGQNPPAGGYLDFGLLKAGDLNGDDQINGLDWSLLKNQYGENGQE